MNRFGSVHLVLYISNILLPIDLILYNQFCRFVLVDWFNRVGLVPNVQNWFSRFVILGY